MCIYIYIYIYMPHSLGLGRASRAPRGARQARRRVNMDGVNMVLAEYYQIHKWLL